MSKPLNLSEYVTGADMPAVSLGFQPAETSVTGFLTDGSVEALRRLWPQEPGFVTWRPKRRWWQLRGRKPMRFLARVTGFTESVGEDGETRLTATFVGLNPEEDR